MNPKRKGRDFIARHGETVFNAARRMQGRLLHTPLTRTGFAQAEEMGEALRAALGPEPALTLWASPTGRALQTLAVIAEHLELDWHAARTDERLGEIDIGSWDGRHYHELAQQYGPMIDPETGLQTRVNTANPNLRMGYAKLMQQQQQGVAAIFKKHGIVLENVGTNGAAQWGLSAIENLALVGDVLDKGL